jgi:hypothetical protein
MSPRAFAPFRLNEQTRTPNAGAQPLPKAGATQERTLEAVGCSPMLGPAPSRSPAPSHARKPQTPDVKQDVGQTGHRLSVPPLALQGLLTLPLHVPFARLSERTGGLERRLLGRKEMHSKRTRPPVALHGVAHIIHPAGSPMLFPFLPQAYAHPASPCPHTALPKPGAGLVGVGTGAEPALGGVERALWIIAIAAIAEQFLPHAIARVIARQIAPPLPGILIAGDPRYWGRLRAAHRLSSCCAYEGYGAPQRPAHDTMPLERCTGARQ